MKNKVFAIEVGTNYDVDIPVKGIISHRILLDGDSGSGKSHKMVSLIESKHSEAQEIVIDLEGEYPDLKNTFDDFLLIGKSTDDIKMDIELNTNDVYVRKLVQKIFDSGANVILDLSEFPNEMHHIASVFGKALLTTKRKIKNPIIVFVDEAHTLCPEKGSGIEEESLRSMIDLAKTGRKRGIGVVMATQELSEFSKRVVRQLKTKIIGNCTYDKDIQRASEYLGLPKTRQHELSELDADHHFFIKSSVTMINGKRFVGVTKIQSTQNKTKLITYDNDDVKIINRNPEKIKSMISAFADIPNQVDHELNHAERLEKDNQEKNQKIIDLNKQIIELSKQSKALDPKEKQAMYESGFREGNLKAKLEAKEILKSISGNYIELQKSFGIVGNSVIKINQIAETLDHHGNEIKQILSSMVTDISQFDKADTAIKKQLVRSETIEQEKPTIQKLTDKPKLRAGAMKILSLVASNNGITKTRLRTRTALKIDTFSIYLNELVKEQWITISGDTVIITSLGLENATIEAQPETHEELLNMWSKHFRAGIMDMLYFICKKRKVSIDILRAEFTFSSSTFDVYLGELKSNDLITVENNYAIASDELFPNE